MKTSRGKKSIHWKGDALFAWLLAGAATADAAAAARRINWLNLISQVIVDRKGYFEMQSR
jgi:hypothetical protein